MLTIISLFLIFVILFTILSVIQKNIMYALFYLALSIIMTSGIFFCLGDYIIGALQIIIYSGAIIVLFVFVIMMFNLEIIKKKKYFFLKNLLSLTYYSFIVLMFFLSFIKIILPFYNKNIISYQSSLYTLGIILFQPYVFMIECISILLLSSLITIILISKHNKNLIYFKLNKEI